MSRGLLRAPNKTMKKPFNCSIVDVTENYPKANKDNNSSSFNDANLFMMFLFSQRREIR